MRQCRLQPDNFTKESGFFDSLHNRTEDVRNARVLAGVACRWQAFMEN
jgi:hypothetical protein